MNPGTFAGPGTGVPYGSISRYIQTPTITSSRTIAVPPGTQRIEALLCGGGGGGSTGGAGFGGCAIIEVPITGYPLQVVIGAGGAANTNGSPTYIVSASVRYAEVGGGGKGSDGGTVGAGRSGGGGGGSNQGYTSGGNGGSPPIGGLLWSIYPTNGGYQTSQSNFPPTGSYYTGSAYISVTSIAPAGAGIGGGNFIYADGCSATNGSFGGGGGGAGAVHYNINNNVGQPGYGGGGAYSGGGSTPGSYGGGGAREQSGGSLTAVTIWGYTGFAGGSTSGSGGGGGGGGMLAAGANGSGSSGGAGGNGGGGGAGANVGVGGTGGAGGNGFAAIRFYL